MKSLNLKFKTFFVLLILLFNINCLYAQSSSFYFPLDLYLDDDCALGSRAMGMGGAFTAIADDASAFYWNPAGLGFQKGNGISAGSSFLHCFHTATSYVNYTFPQSSISILRTESSTQLFPSSAQLFSSSYYFNGMSDIFISSHAISPVDFLSIGLNLKGINVTSGNTVTVGYGCDLGVLLKTKYFNLGLDIQDLFTQIGILKAYPRYRVGFGTNLPGNIKISLQAEGLDLGQIPVNSRDKIRFVVPQFRAGIEKWLFDGHVGIRGGYSVIPYSIFSSVGPFYVPNEYAYLSYFSETFAFDEHRISIGASLKFKEYSLDCACILDLPWAAPCFWFSASFMWDKTK